MIGQVRNHVMIPSIHRLVCLASISRSPSISHHFQVKNSARTTYVIWAHHKHGKRISYWLNVEWRKCVFIKTRERRRRHDRLFVQSIFSRQISNRRAKKKEGTQEREIRKESKGQEDHAGTRRYGSMHFGWMVKERYTLKGYFKEAIFFVIKECVLLIWSESKKPLQKWESVQKMHFLDLALEEDCAKWNTPFALKRREQKKEQKQRHYWRQQQLKPRHVQIVTHILKTMLRENTLLGLWHFFPFIS